MRRFGMGAMLAAALGASSGCSSGGVTAGKVEAALASTFANLVHLQESMLGLPSVEAPTLRASASCHKVAPGSGDRGAGTWKCTITWHTVQGSPLRDAYEVSVTMDGCYTATVDGAHMGGPTITAQNGDEVVNLLYVFDGCFDPS